MFAVCFREFKSLFKSIRSLIIIGVIFGVTLGAAKIVSLFQSQLQEFGLGDSAYATGLLILILIASPLFVSTLTHSTINEEVKSRTIRFIATKTSRENIVFGKFLGNLFFWIVCLFIALLLITPFSKAFHVSELMECIVFVSYFVGLSLLFSTLIPKPGVTGFLGMAIAVIVPIVGLWSIASENIFLKIYSFITPYYFFSHDNDSYIYIVLIYPIIFLVISLITIRKRDL